MKPNLDELVNQIENDVHPAHLRRLQALLAELTTDEEVVYGHTILPLSEERRRAGRTFQLVVATASTWIVGTVLCSVPGELTPESFSVDVVLYPLSATRIKPIAIAPDGGRDPGRIDFEVHLPEGRMVTLGKSAHAAGSGRRSSVGDPFEVVRLLRDRWRVGTS